jgi:(S)-2-hydroxy-acid oxidase
MYGLAAAGEDGARHVLELLRDELLLTLCLLGCSSPEQLTGAHVQRSSA